MHFSLWLPSDAVKNRILGKQVLCIAFKWEKKKLPFALKIKLLYLPSHWDKPRARCGKWLPSILLQATYWYLICVFSKKKRNTLRRTTTHLFPPLINDWISTLKRPSQHVRPDLVTAMNTEVWHMNLDRTTGKFQLCVVSGCVLYLWWNCSAPNYSVLNSLACFPSQYNHILQLLAMDKETIVRGMSLDRSKQDFGDACFVQRE